MHVPQRQTIDVLLDHLICVNDDGTIGDVLEPSNPAYGATLASAEAERTLTVAPPNTFFIPGLVDLHIHAPQWPQLGKALNLPLQDWLQKATFPLEARYDDIGFANSVYSSLVENLLANGTTSAVYFATTHEPATKRLAEICLSKGQRAWVGRVAMDDHEQCPDYYRDASAEQALIASENSLLAIRGLPDNAQQRVKPILTPRFIPACTDELLKGFGSLAKRYDCHVQTHCSESDWEHQFVLDRLGQTDTHALEGFGLLTRKTVLAHSNFINSADMKAIEHCGSGIAHCPLSNNYFAGAVFPLRSALEKGLHVGLGTDISGGHSASMLDTCRHAISASRLLESGVDSAIVQSERGVPNSQLNFLDAFYLATTGGGIVLDEPIGQFKTGYHFDALLIDPGSSNSTLSYFPELDTEKDLLQKIVYTATRGNIRQVFIGGREVSKL